jgi:hypothetical protein
MSTSRTREKADGELFKSTGIDDNATSTAVTIDASENVGIGVVPEAWNLGGALQIGRTSITGQADAAGGNLSYNTYYNSGWKYKDSLATSQLAIVDGLFTFKVAPSGSADAAISWTTGFEVLAGGKARAKNGLLFGTDTAAANTLDDYEEGTWTPVIRGVGGNPTITYQSGGQQGYYTKIGNMIYCSFIVAIAGGGYSGGSGDVFIEAPFTSANHDMAAAAFAVNRMTNTGDLSGSRTDLSFSMVGNSNQMRLTQFGGNLGTTQWTNGVSTGQISAGSEFAGTMIIRV